MTVLEQTAGQRIRDCGMRLCRRFFLDMRYRRAMVVGAMLAHNNHSFVRQW
jgi:hypothetical protein